MMWIAAAEISDKMLATQDIDHHLKLNWNDCTGYQPWCLSVHATHGVKQYALTFSFIRAAMAANHKSALRITRYRQVLTIRSHTGSYKWQVAWNHENNTIEAPARVPCPSNLVTLSNSLETRWGSTHFMSQRQEVVKNLWSIRVEHPMAFTPTKTPKPATARFQDENPSRIPCMKSTYHCNTRVAMINQPHLRYIFKVPTFAVCIPVLIIGAAIQPFPTIDCRELILIINNSSLYNQPPSRCSCEIKAAHPYLGR
jgi:hypothetical protein